jgi:NAD(P)-dependent dehydrogenase (short-subunit alcohol dehydrogenase family)
MVKDIFSVVGKTAMVTGASSGLDEEFAQILASRGANVVLAARRTDRLQELAESITRDGGTALPITCDVADSAQVATAWDRFGREMRTVFAAAAFVVAGVATAQAADIAAKTGYEAKLDADSSALVYYTGAPDGFHVVVTTQQGLTDQAAVARFETVLATGQSATVSVPRGAGEAPARIVLSNAGDHLHIAEPNGAVSAR